MLPNDGHANTQTQARATTRPLGGVKGIEKFGKRLLRHAYAVILNGNRNVPADASDAYLDAPALAHFANGVFGIADQVQEDLNQLIGVANHGRQIRLRLKIDANIVAAQRMIL